MWSVLQEEAAADPQLIGEGTVVHGEVRFEEGLRIDGEVHRRRDGRRRRPSLLVISEKARVHGQGQGRRM